MTGRDYQPHNSGVTPRFQEIPAFMRVAQAPIEPPLDPTGITCVNAANPMFEIVCVVAGRRSRCD